FAKKPTTVVEQRVPADRRSSPRKENPMIRSRSRALIRSTLAMLLLPAPRAGATAAAEAGMGHVASAHHRHAGSAHRRHHHGIPQHNGGDGDSDNNGAASAGGGNL